MRSRPAPDRPAFEQLFSTPRMTIMKFTTIYLHLCCEFGNSALSSGFRFATHNYWIMADIVTSAMRASHRSHHA
jgi:hypothetical protein